MGMNMPQMQPSAEILGRQAFQGNPAPDQMHQDMSPQNQPVSGQPPMNPMQQQQQQQQPDPTEALPLVLLSYLDFAQGIKDKAELADNVKSQIMLQMAQAVNYLFPLMPKADPQQQMDAQLKVAEFQMKQQESQQKLALEKEKHAMDIQKSQHDLQLKQAEGQMKLQQSQQEHQQKLQHTQVAHEQSIIQSAEAAKQQAAQAKQTPQSKPSSKQGKN